MNRHSQSQQCLLRISQGFDSLLNWGSAHGKCITFWTLELSSLLERYTMLPRTRVNSSTYRDYLPFLSSSLVRWIVLPLPPQGTCGDIWRQFDHHNSGWGRYYWHLGRSNRCCWTSHNAQGKPGQHRLIWSKMSMMLRSRNSSPLLLFFWPSAGH